MFRDFTKYEVFDDGRVWSYARNKFLKPQKQINGYYKIQLTDNDGTVKNYNLHRVVYEACSQAPIPEGLQVNHINENKADNRFENLNLMTPKENSNWGTLRERLSTVKTNNPKCSKLVAQYDKDNNLINVFPSMREVERQLGFSNSHIYKCCQGQYKQAYGFIWRYVT